MEPSKSKRKRPPLFLCINCLSEELVTEDYQVWTCPVCFYKIVLS
jgi:DNA-directed RNA polymerase subunit RPC12/RpoP